MSKKLHKNEVINFFRSVPIQIRFNDIDSLGHVNNSMYQQYFDIGRIDYFDNVLGEKMNWETEGLILVNISISFLAQIKQYDSIVVKTKIVKLGNKSLEMKQEIFNGTTGKTASASTSIMVGYCGKKEESIPVPKRWRERIISFERDILF